MGSDSSAENTQNAPKLFFPICLPKPKSLEFQWKKASLGVRSRCLYALYKQEKPTFIQFIFDDSKIVCSIVLNIMQG